MSMPTLTPAYGRDYKSVAAAVADFEAGKDFILNDYSSPWDGKPCNAESLRNGPSGKVLIRYDKMRKVLVAKIPGWVGPEA